MTLQEELGNLNVFIYKLVNGSTIVGLVNGTAVESVEFPYFLEETDFEGTSIWSLVPIISLIGNLTYSKFDIKEDRLLISPFLASVPFAEAYRQQLEFDISIARRKMNGKLQSQASYIESEIHNYRVADDVDKKIESKEEDIESLKHFKSLLVFDIDGQTKH